MPLTLFCTPLQRSHSNCFWLKLNLHNLAVRGQYMSFFAYQAWQAQRQNNHARGPYKNSVRAAHSHSYERLLVPHAQAPILPQYFAAPLQAQQAYPMPVNTGLDPRVAAQNYSMPPAQPYPAAVPYSVPPSPPLLPVGTGERHKWLYRIILPLLLSFPGF